MKNKLIDLVKKIQKINWTKIFPFILLNLFLIIGAFYFGLQFNKSTQTKYESIPISTPSISPTPTITQQPATEESQLITQKPTITPTPTKTIISTTNWKTYKNGTLGFQLKHPAEWIVTEDSEKITFTDEIGGPWLFAVIMQISNKSLADNTQSRIDELKAIVNSAQINLSNTTLGGLDGKKITLTAEGGGIIDYLLQSGDRFYIITIRSESELINNILKSFQLIPISSFTVINNNYKIIKNTTTELNLIGPGYSGQVKDLTLNFYKFKKPAEQKLENWIEQNKGILPKSTFEGVCDNLGSSETITLYNCGRWGEEDFLINKKGDLILFIAQGQDPPLTSTELLKLISFN